jgi:hypothetical protein
MRSFLPTILFVSFIRFGGVAFGQLGATPVPVRPLTPHPTSVPVVLSVDADTITVQNGLFTGSKGARPTEGEKKTQSAANIRTYKVSRFTEITINGHRSTLADIKAGMQVRITAGTDPTQASIIAAKVDRSILVPVP